jgi:hypothetical protein
MEAAPRPAANSWALAKPAGTIARAATWGGTQTREPSHCLLVHKRLTAPWFMGLSDRLLGPPQIVESSFGAYPT